MASKAWIHESFMLSNNLKIPAIGLGTYRIKKAEEIHLALDSALIKSNYKLIDTAAVYRNEEHIASTLKSLAIDRKSVFITSKLAPRDHGADKARAAFEKSLENLNTDYLDLYLIHWPGVQGLNVDQVDINRKLRLESWRVLESLYEEGRAKAIGVSNYNVTHLKELLDQCKIRPHVNQIEVQPHYQQRDLVDFCKKEGIHVTAYSSLGTTVTSSPLLLDEAVAEVAKSASKSPAQILLAWALQKGFSVVPKSTNPDHIIENGAIDFELTDEQMAMLDNLDKDKKYAWNPESVK